MLDEPTGGCGNADPDKPLCRVIPVQGISCFGWRGYRGPTGYHRPLTPSGATDALTP
jgi:hypothetical protein